MSRLIQKSESASVAAAVAAEVHVIEDVAVCYSVLYESSTHFGSQVVTCHLLLF